MRGYLIDVENGTHDEVEASGLDDYYRLVGCRCIDIAVRDIGGRPYNIVLDDEGLLVDKPIVSAYMDGRPALAGNLIVFGLHPDTFDLDGLTERDVRNVKEHVRLALGFGRDGEPKLWPVLTVDAPKW